MANLEEFLSNYSPAVRSIARETRGIVLEIIPDMLEVIDLPGEAIVFKHARPFKEPVCAITPGRSHIKLVFYNGTRLADPKGLLTSNGNGTRYARLHSLYQALSPGISDLLEAAAVNEQLQPNSAATRSQLRVMLKRS